MTPFSDLYDPDQDLPTPARPATPPAPYYQAQTTLLACAVDNDRTAAAQVLSYLISSLPDLRHIMHNVLHQQRDPAPWRCLLTYLAWGRWGDWRTAVTNNGRALPALDWKEPSHDAAIRAITDIFTLDETPEEAALKNDLLTEDMQGPPTIRHAAAYLLGMRGMHHAIPVLAEIIAHPEQHREVLDWQLRAVHALAALHDPRSAPPLIAALASGRGELHRLAGWALHELGRDAQPALLEALQHPDSHIRWHAARCLGQCADASGAHVLVEGLYDERPEVRWATANVVAGLDAKAVPHILRAMIVHPLKESYRQAIYHALHGMPSHHTQQRLQPLLAALRGPASSVQAPTVAQKLLAEWEV